MPEIIKPMPNALKATPNPLTDFVILPMPLELFVAFFAVLLKDFALLSPIFFIESSVCCKSLFNSITGFCALSVSTTISICFCTAIFL